MAFTNCCDGTKKSHDTQCRLLQIRQPQTGSLALIMNTMSFIEEFQRELKRQQNRGRCLHYASGTHCNEIISAHSIQNKGQLNLIAENGHVYRFNADISTLKRTGGLPAPNKIGIKKASTFAGFCKYHDNALFEPIDNKPLTQNKKQIALYAYRCICRELVTKENASIAMGNMKSYTNLSAQQESILHNCDTGYKTGLSGLKHHKLVYDQALAAQDYEPFEYTYFTSSDPCNIQLSGLLYPDYDFKGNFLQDLGEQTRPLNLITFFTAPTPEGWAFCFAWHKSSSEKCIPFLSSLAAVIYSGEKPQDALLRFSLSCCENHAIRISWWDQLSKKMQQEAIDRVHLMTSLSIPVPSDYLRSGCDGIANWEFVNVMTSL